MKQKQKKKRSPKSTLLPSMQQNQLWRGVFQPVLSRFIWLSKFYPTIESLEVILESSANFSSDSAGSVPIGIIVEATSNRVIMGWLWSYVVIGYSGVISRASRQLQRYNSQIQLSKHETNQEKGWTPAGWREWSLRKPQISWRLEERGTQDQACRWQSSEPPSWTGRVSGLSWEESRGGGYE